MANRSERDMAIDKVAPEFIEKLVEWIANEKMNLDDFIANPQGHVMYNPYIDVDFDMLAMRSEMLNQVIGGLRVIIAFKNGNPDVTRAMHDLALDSMPYQVFDRLVEWIDRMHRSMTGNVDLPLKDYGELISFNRERYEEDMRKHVDALEGLRIVQEFGRETQMSVAGAENFAKGTLY